VNRFLTVCALLIGADGRKFDYLARDDTTPEFLLVEISG
jgi:hypothetical protein